MSIHLIICSIAHFNLYFIFIFHLKNQHIFPNSLGLNAYISRSSSDVLIYIIRIKRQSTRKLKKDNPREEQDVGKNMSKNRDRWITINRGMEYCLKSENK